MKKSWAIGVDVGGTKIAAGIVNFPTGEVRLRRQIPTAPARGGEAVFRDVLRLCKELTVAAQRLEQRVESIGIGLCELVDLKGNPLSQNCVGWRSMPVCERLSRLAPTIIEADVRAAALAEAMFGAGKPFGQFVYITVGTGISCCLILDGKPFAGAHGATGTLGSSPMSAPCEQCGYESQRTLEEIASGPALVRRYHQRRGAGAETGEAVLAAVVGGDRDATRVVRSAGETLGAAAGWLVNVLDPEALIVGGGLGLSEGPFWKSFLASTRRHIWFEKCRNLPIVRAATGADAGLIGAAVAAWLRFQAYGLPKPQRTCKTEQPNP